MKKHNSFTQAPFKGAGFTLIELLVVIAIIGLLSTLAVVSLNNARQKSRDARRVADIKHIQNGLELYYDDNQGYPIVAVPGIPLGAAAARTLCATSDFAAVCVGTQYLGKVPANPTPGGTAYTYMAPITTTYTLTYTLEATTGSVPGGILNTASPESFY